MFIRMGYRPPPVRKSLQKFRFGNEVFDSLLQIDPPLSTPPGNQTILARVDVVAVDVPALLGASLSNLSLRDMFVHSVTP